MPFEDMPLQECGEDRMRLAAYVDGEVAGAEAEAMELHLAGCARCAAETAALMRMKRELRAARSFHVPDAEFRRKIQGQVSSVPRRRWRGWLIPMIELAAAMVLIVAAVRAVRTPGPDAWTEVVDLHASALASANPYDVVSSDRHTVKPWFQGKIPFSFNLPELKGSGFALEGGRMVYVGQEPAAQLIYRLGQHRLSVLVVRKPGDAGQAGGAPVVEGRDAFNTAAWRSRELRFYLVSDADRTAVEQLAALMAQANP